MIGSRERLMRRERTQIIKRRNSGSAAIYRQAHRKRSSPLCLPPRIDIAGTAPRCGQTWSFSGVGTLDQWQSCFGTQKASEVKINVKNTEVKLGRHTC